MAKVTKVMSGGYTTREDYSHDSPDPDKGYVWSEEEGAMVPVAQEEETTRVTPTGITQSGKKLGIGDINGLFAALNERGQMSAGELPSANKFFSEALPTTEQSSEQGGELPTGEPTPIKTGSDPENAEDGTSNKPDIADQIRQVRMDRNSGRGSRRDPRNRGGGSDEPFGGVSETKGNGMTKERMAARAAILDPSNKGYGAIRAADRAVGAYHQYDTGGMNIDGKDVKFNEGMSRDARYELRGGGIQSKEDAQEFLKKYTSALASTDTTPEPPASEQTPTTLTPETPRNPSTATKPSNPTIIDSTAPHPDTLRKPDAATEASNREYASTKFKFDPEKGMMVPVQ